MWKGLSCPVDRQRRRPALNRGPRGHKQKETPGCGPSATTHAQINVSSNALSAIRWVLPLRERPGPLLSPRQTGNVPSQPAVCLKLEADRLLLSASWGSSFLHHKALATCPPVPSGVVRVLVLCVMFWRLLAPMSAPTYPPLHLLEGEPFLRAQLS